MEAIQPKICQLIDVADKEMEALKSHKDCVDKDHTQLLVKIHKGYEELLQTLRSKLIDANLLHLLSISFYESTYNEF